MIKFTTFLYYSIPYTDVDTGYWSAEGLGKTVTALGLWKREEQQACTSLHKIYFVHRTIFCFVSFLKDSGRASMEN